MSISSPLHLKFNRSPLAQISSSSSTIHAFFNSELHPATLAVIDGSSRVTWNFASSTSASPAFLLPQPFPRLRPGANDLTFALNPFNAPLPPPPSALASSQIPSVKLRAFYWPLPPDKLPRVVVVDIDGTKRHNFTFISTKYMNSSLVSTHLTLAACTVTRSDVAGHVLPLLGLSWTQPNVVPLMQSIASNGYRIVFLTSRPLVMAEPTRRYLTSLGLPDAPVITSPYACKIHNCSLVSLLWRQQVQRMRVTAARADRPCSCVQERSAAGNSTRFPSRRRQCRPCVSCRFWQSRDGFESIRFGWHRPRAHIHCE
jgi:hypothetical protein